ncbi:surface protein TolT [Trypanosoma conorhini]|uniref:Surface protein TolT n=1 Tax=Trypanosoma conorhini TaxID=83891 RepID=A0A3R7K7A2_9TRYP|nr:surface protein TolT [Trypanosoma conorhini]RNF02917.1 surface protein TolT [Trypanosoma conorhini]
MKCRALCALLALALCCSVHCFVADASAAKPPLAPAPAPVANSTAGALPRNMKQVLEEALKAVLKSQEDAHEASTHCVEAKLSAANALKDEQEAEEILRGLDAELVPLSKSLPKARQARKEAAAAAAECERASSAALTAEGVALAAVQEVLNHTLAARSDRMKHDAESLEKVSALTKRAIAEAHKVEKHAEKAAVAATGALKAAQKAEEALSAVKEVASIASLLLQKFAKEEERRFASERARADATTKRAESAELAAKVAEEKLANAGVSTGAVYVGGGAQPGSRSPRANTVIRRDGDVIAACVRAPLLLLVALGCVVLSWGLI